ncbi:MAG: peroxiredoxin family protein [Acidiferrobacterales bacterium]
MNKRLCRGESAPAFRVPDLQGHTVDMRNFRGRWLLLSFCRYASCPLCNLRMHELSGLHAGWQTHGLDMLAVLQSPADKLRQYVDRQHLPFLLIPDPEQTLYQRYGVGHCWIGFLVVWGKRLPEISRAVLRERYFPGSVEGGIHRIPADFLINQGGRIAEAHYGCDIGDHLPVARIEHQLANGSFS